LTTLTVFVLRAASAEQCADEPLVVHKSHSLVQTRPLPTASEPARFSAEVPPPALSTAEVATGPSHADPTRPFAKNGLAGTAYFHPRAILSIGFLGVALAVAGALGILIWNMVAPLNEKESHSS
ncbi:unnamed protein product, partial [Polarella glacialis]